jgi:hypothetical protein
VFLLIEFLSFIGTKMMRLMKTALILCFFLPSVCYGGKSVIDKTAPLEARDELRASPTSSASREKEDPKRNSEESPVKKRVTWAELPDSENQPAKRQKLSAEELFFSDKERTFETNLAFIQEEIAKAHEQIEPWRIRRAHRQLYTLDYQEDVWERHARALNAYRWPSQKSWRDVVAGHLFFPQETFEWEVIPSEEYRLRRIDNLWSYAAAAKSNHAVGKYYLVRMLDKILRPYCDEHPEFFDRRYKEAFEDLKKCEDNPDACYVIGVNYEEMPYLSSKYVEREKSHDHKALEWHSKGGDLKNRYQILMLRKIFSKVYEPVSSGDFLALGRAGFNPAYNEAFELTETLEEEEPILQEVVATGFKPALLWLGGHYRDAGNDEQGKELYQRAGEAGVISGYIRLGILEVGNVLRYRLVYPHRGSSSS